MSMPGKKIRLSIPLGEGAGLGERCLPPFHNRDVCGTAVAILLSPTRIITYTGACVFLSHAFHILTRRQDALCARKASESKQTKTHTQNQEGTKITVAPAPAPAPSTHHAITQHQQAAEQPPSRQPNTHAPSVAWKRPGLHFWAPCGVAALVGVLVSYLCRMPRKIPLYQLRLRHSSTA